MIDPIVVNVRVLFSRFVRVSPPLLAFLMVSSMLVGVTATWAVTPDRGITMVRGTVVGTIADVSVIGFLADGQPFPYENGGSLNGGEMMSVLADVSWTDTRGTVHTGHPIACIPPSTQRRRVVLGLAEYTIGTSDRTRRIVVQVHCLTP